MLPPHRISLVEIKGKKTGAVTWECHEAEELTNDICEQQSQGKSEK